MVNFVFVSLSQTTDMGRMLTGRCGGESIDKRPVLDELDFDLHPHDKEAFYEAAALKGGIK